MLATKPGAIPALMADKRPYYITTAISYPNDAPHIGHAYEAVATDALARFRRLQGRDVFFLTGTDEHGIKMLQTAKAQGIAPAELADRNTPKFQDMVRVLNCSNDDFIRTREERHKLACQELWRRMQAAGDIYRDKYAGWYSVRDEAYYDESELKEGADGRNSRRRERRSSGSRRRVISSSSLPTRTGCSPITRRIPNSLDLTRARTK